MQPIRNSAGRSPDRDRLAAAGGPPDAFEVALLDANTMGSLVGTAAGLSNTDALLNVQANGDVFFGPQATVSGASVSGQKLTGSFPLTVTVGLGGVAPGTMATLYFDLLGFGVTDSSVQLDDVVLTAAAGNQPPVAVDDAASTGEDTVLIVSVPGVLSNDTDADLGDTKTVVAVNGQSAAVGTQLTLATGALLTVQADGSYRYDPNGQFESLGAGQSATDTFSYTMADSAGATSSAAVTITIQGVNDAPQPINDTASTGENQVLLVAAPGVLANDTDADAGETKTVVAVNDQSAAAGTTIALSSGALLTVQADGSYRYDPNGKFESLGAGHSATDSFTYTLADTA